MAILVSAHKLRKAFAARPLFDELTFSIESGEKIGLIGPNGAGKSTLLRIFASQTSPDDGKLSFQRGVKIGFLEQVPTFTSDSTVLAAVLAASDDPDDWNNIATAGEFLSKLNLNEEDQVSSLSGGWKKRVALARELVKRPDLLLLDEPTNHLDVESILWLEEFLSNAPFATLTITHDRLFLQRIANRILELDRRNPGGLLSISGDYAHYLETKDLMMAAQERREGILKNTLRRETEWLRRGAKARTTKQQARIQRHGELKGEVEELEVRNQVRTARIEFQGAEKNPKKLIEAKNLSKSYGKRKIFDGVNLFITPGSRIGLLGANGCGKSTLIRVLLGDENPDTGTVLRSEHLSVAYFEQNRETLDPTLTVLKTLCPQGDHVDFQGRRVHIRSYLDRFLFSQGQMEMAVGKLSGGEQSRLLIARLMLNSANLLVLDEPTNDLDMATLAVLEDCLTEFQGAVLLVTHDRYFLDQVAQKILAFTPEGVIPFDGLSQWEVWYTNFLAKTGSNSTQSKPQLTTIKESVAPKAPEKKRKLSYNDQREFDSMESNIHTAEARLKALEAESLLKENLSNSKKLGEISKEMKEVQARIDYLYIRWEELEN